MECVVSQFQNELDRLDPFFSPAHVLRRFSKKAPCAPVADWLTDIAERAELLHYALENDLLPSDVASNCRLAEVMRFCLPEMPECGTCRVEGCASNARAN